MAPDQTISSGAIVSLIESPSHTVTVGMVFLTADLDLLVFLLSTLVSRLVDLHLARQLLALGFKVEERGGHGGIFVPKLGGGRYEGKAGDEGNIDDLGLKDDRRCCCEANWLICHCVMRLRSALVFSELPSFELLMHLSSLRSSLFITGLRSML
jgi:hypothetical protein